MRTIRRIATIAATAAALAIGPVATAQAASPEIVDPAGDARTSLGVNQGAIDIRAVDVAVDGAQLTYTIQVDAYPALENRLNSYTVEFVRSDGRLVSATASNAPTPPGSRYGFGTALLFDRVDVDPENPDPSIYGVGGTAVVDRATDRITLSFPIDAVRAESERTGVPVLGAAFDAARAQSSTATNFRVVATDTASGGAFTLGG